MATENNETPPADVVIIGGGPAGMSAALTAGRALLNTVVVNAESPRNAVTTASHGFLTRDGAHPTELLAVAKQQLGKYETVRYVNDTVSTATAVENGFGSGFEAGFEITLASGEKMLTRRLIVATGHADDLKRLDLPGIEAVYGKSVYPCMFCDGFEHRGERLAMFGREGAIHYAPMGLLWTDDLIVFTNGASLSPDQTAELEAHGVAVHSEQIQHLESSDGTLTAVELVTGERIERDAGFISDEYSEPASTFAETLGVTSSLNDWGMMALDATETGSTSVAGLHVIGDARIGFSGLIAAAAEGAACAEGIVHEIASERWSKQ
ncbi:MAG: NAD(P)/FAD-dependent oxidoreductase [Acidimicrobiales bacterium]